jgi:formylglycine-generating enzyme required for sulfatase activity
VPTGYDIRICPTCKGKGRVAFKPEADEMPAHRVRLSKAFFLGQTVVTQGQWKAVMGTEPWSGKDAVREGDDYPAVYVTWDDAQAFCRKLSEQEGKTYRLPTEAEWEYACRAGTSTLYSFGDDASRLGEYAWFTKNAADAGESYAHKVGTKRPNPWGLYDMHGNVCEWCQDWYGPYGTAAQVDPAGPSSGSDRVLRGGRWVYLAAYCRSAFRDGYLPDYGLDSFGFRVVLGLPRTP